MDLWLDDPESGISLLRYAGSGKAMRTRLLAYQKEYYERTASEARKEAVQGYVFDTRGSKSVAFHFLENMARHHIEVYQLAKDYQAAGNKEFQKVQPMSFRWRKNTVRWLRCLWRIV